MALSSTNILKVIVVTDNLEKTVAGYKTLFGTGTAPEEAPHKDIKEPYTIYKGQPGEPMDLKVESVFSDNFWFEVIEPVSDNSPWYAWLKEHGTSICSVCLLSNGPLENDEAVMKEAGFESLFKQEKGYEAYEYFDAAKTLGVLVEMKEHY
ncbi:MAG: VOC family protein [Clostridiales bacterium]|nr:VOC family protein [Candidatus Blautia equi]